MKIGFDARLINSLGIGRYISGLLPPLADLLGANLTIVTSATQVALVRALTAGRPRVTVSNTRPYRLGGQSTLLAALLGAGVDLMHFPHYDLPLLYPGRFVVTIHDLFSFHYPEIHSGALPRLSNQLLINRAVSRATAIITPSQATAEEVRHRYPRTRQKITAIPEAAGERFHAERDREAEAAWQRYFGIRPPYVLYLGQWKPYKNVATLIEAFALVRATQPQAQLVLAGNDPRYPEIRAAAERLPQGSVVLPGRLPDDAVPDLYRGAAAVVVPSLAEGFGLPVLEAMASGVPVVCSDIPVLHEIADQVAIFCPPTDVQAFAAGMVQALYLTPEDARIRAGLERAHQFSWRRAAEQTVAIYERALAARPSRRSETD